MTDVVLPLGAKGFLHGSSDTASSKDGREVEDIVAKFRRELAVTATVGLNDMTIRADLRQVAAEACERNWDGHGAAPYSPTALAHAKRLANTFPTWIPAPRCAVDSDGEIGFDWYSDANNLLSLSVGADGRVSFAGRYDGIRRSGRNDFADELPPDIVEILRRIYPQACESLAA